MKKSISFILISGLIGSLLLFNSCTKDKSNSDPLTQEWLLPLLKAEIQPFHLTNLKNQKFHFEITPADCGLPEGSPIPLPAGKTVLNVGPFKIGTNDLIQEVQFDKCLLELTLTNNFPIPIKKGSLLSIKTGNSTTPIISFRTGQDIADGASYSQTFDLSGKSIKDNIDITFDSLIISNTSGDVTFNESIALDFDFKELTVQSVKLTGDKTFVIKDTADFDGASIEFDEENLNISDSMIQATLNLRAVNDFPFELNFQVYFLSELGTMIDSLFSPASTIESADYPGGVFSASKASNLKTLLSKPRLEKIKDAKLAVYSIVLDTKGQGGGSPILVERDRMLKMKMVGDIRLILSPDIFNLSF